MLSQGNQGHDRVVKGQWYQLYGVREYWLVDLISRQIEVRDLTSRDVAPRAFEARAIVRSRVLPRLRLRVVDLFEG